MGDTKVNYSTFLEQCRKTPPRIYYTWLYHQIAYPLSFIMYRLGMSPNAISLASIALNFVAAYLIIFEFELLWGLIVFFASYIVDCCDGNVARIDYKYSGKRQVGSREHLRGVAYENLNTNISNFLFFISLGYYFYITEVNIALLYLAIATFGVKFLTRYTSLHMSILIKEIGTLDMRSQKEKRLFQPTLLNEIKYFFTRVLNSARLYYILFIAAIVIIPAYLIEFYIAYFGIILVLSLIKLVMTFVRALP